MATVDALLFHCPTYSPVRCSAPLCPICLFICLQCGQLLALAIKCNLARSLLHVKMAEAMANGKRQKQKAKGQSQAGGFLLETVAPETS